MQKNRLKICWGGEFHNFAADNQNSYQDEKNFTFICGYCLHGVRRMFERQ